MGATLGVAADVERKNHLRRKLAAFFQNRVDGVHINIGMAGDGLQIVGDLEQLVHYKLHVAQGRGVRWHIGSSLNTLENWKLKNVET